MISKTSATPSKPVSRGGDEEQKSGSLPDIDGIETNLNNDLLTEIPTKLPRSKTAARLKNLPGGDEIGDLPVTEINGIVKFMK